MSRRPERLSCGVFDPYDLRMMSVALRIAKRRALHDLDQGQEYTLRVIILRLFRSGLRQPRKLGLVAVSLVDRRSLKGWPCRATEPCGAENQDTHIGE